MQPEVGGEPDLRRPYAVCHAQPLGRATYTSVMVGQSDELFVGRKAELAALNRFADRGRVGSRALVVVGNGGAGKSALLREYRRLLRGSVVAVSCWPGGSPMWPWDEVSRALTGEPLPRAGDRFEQFTAALESFATAMTANPVTVVLDDAHLADPASLLFARFLARAPRPEGLKVLLATRPVEQLDSERAAAIGELLRDATEVRLGPLAPHEVDEVLTRVGPGPLTPEHHEAIRVLTGGVALHVHSVAFSMASGGSVPDGIGEFVAGRLAAAGAAGGQVVEAACVLGPTARPVDVAEVLGTPLSFVLAGADAASRAGLLDTTGVPLIVVHDVVREIVLDHLERTRIDVLRARAIAVLAGANTSVERLATAAALAARRATLGPEHVDAAVELYRATADRFRRSGAIESAIEAMRAAVALAEADRRPVLTASLVDFGESLRAAGRLSQARDVFFRAVDTLDDPPDVDLQARIAIGLGGIWLNEHREPVRAAFVRDLQERAAAQCPPGLVRDRLLMRLAAEHAYHHADHRDPDDPAIVAVQEATGQVRRHGDALALAEALSLTAHVLLAPQRDHDRHRVVAEQVEAAGRSASAVAGLMALCWQTVDCFLSGAPTAGGVLDRLVERADVLRCHAVAFVASAMRVTVALRDGRLDEAEAMAIACHEVGMSAGDADASVYLYAQLGTIRWFQGRSAEIATLATAAADDPTLHPRDWSVRASVAMLNLEAGDATAARRLLDRVANDELPQPSSTSLVAVSICADLAARTGHTAAGGVLLDELRDLVGRPVVASLAVQCLGPVERAIGLATLATGDVDSSIDWMRRARTASVDLRHRPATAIITAELADLLHRVHGGDIEAVTLLRSARAEADEMGMTGWSERWGRLLDDWQSGPPKVELERAGGHTWSVTFGRERVTLPDRIGLGYLAVLVAAPGSEVAALHLASSDAVPSTPAEPVLDAAGLATLRRHLVELDALVERPLSEARRRAVQSERDAVAGELDRQRRPGGVRTFVDSNDRARVAVRKAIVRAIDEIERSAPMTGRHLRASVHTGTHCVYRPV